MPTKANQQKRTANSTVDLYFFDVTGGVAAGTQFQVFEGSSITINKQTTNNKMNQEQKKYLLKKVEQISELFDEIHDLLSEETIYAMCDGLDALSAEMLPLWEEQIRNDKQTELNL